MTLFHLLALLFFGTCSFANAPSCMKAQRVVVILPDKHAALDLIQSGISDNWKGQESIVSFNANGSADQMQTIYNTISESDDVAAVLPVGKTATQIAIRSLGAKTPIIGVAANVENTHLGENACCVIDEINPKYLISTLVTLVPTAKRFTLLIANVEKSLSEKEEIEKIASDYGISLKTLVVNNLNEITTLLTKDALEDSHGVIILKDHVTASAATHIRKICDEASVLFVSSDEGSATAGAHLAVGVSEYSIGAQAANLGSQITAGKLKASEVGRSLLDERAIHVYINKAWVQKVQAGNSCTRSNVNLNLLQNSVLPVKEV